MRRPTGDGSCRLRRARLPGGLAVGVTATAALAATAITIQPASHDFGDQGLNVAGNFQVFEVTLPTGAGTTDTVDAQIQGADASQFIVDRGTVAARPGNYQSTCINQWRTGACGYVVEFRPTSVGVKTATLIVADTRGNRGTAALKGNGVAGCRPYLVHCNYADYYSGTITFVTNEHTDKGQDRKGTWWSKLIIAVEKGVARCEGTQKDSLATYNEDGKLTSTTVSNGVVSGPGLFAVEFERSGGRLEYTLSFACPSAMVGSTLTDFSEGTTTTSLTMDEPADWRGVTLGADPQPATKVFMDLLDGRQTDPRPDLGDDVVGKTEVVWSLKRS
jgi:hypothetical protein